MSLRPARLYSVTLSQNTKQTKRMEKIEQEISSRPRFQSIISIPGSLERSLAVGTYNKSKLLEIFPNIGR